MTIANTYPRVAQAVAVTELRFPLDAGAAARGAKPQTLRKEELRSLRLNRTLKSEHQVLELATVAGATPHPLMAGELVPASSAQEIMQLQSRVREIADRYGFPNPLSSSMGAAFDQALAFEIGALLPGLVPAEAAQDEIWHFIAAFVLPDVSLWRWPTGERRAPSEVAVLDEEDAEPARANAGRTDINLDRLIKSRRHWLKDAWRKHYFVPSEHILAVDADLWEQIRGRPTLFGDRRVVQSYLTGLRLHDTEELATNDRRARRRSTAARLYRRAEVISLASLDGAGLADLVAAAVEDSSPGAAEPSTLVDFVTQSARIGIEIEPALRVSLPDDSQLPPIRAALERHRARHAESHAAREVSAQCSIWLDQWTELASEHRHIALSVILYFLLEEDQHSDLGRSGLDDDRALTAVAARLIPTNH